MTVSSKMQSLVVIYESLFTLHVLLRYRSCYYLHIKCFADEPMRKHIVKYCHVFFTSSFWHWLNSLFQKKERKKKKLNLGKVNTFMREGNLFCIFVGLKLNKLFKWKWWKECDASVSGRGHHTLYFNACDHLYLSANEQLSHRNHGAIKLSRPAERM